MPARKSLLPPGLEGDDGHGIREIEAPTRRFHRNEQRMIDPDPIQDNRGQSACFGPEHEGVAGLKS